MGVAFLKSYLHRLDKSGLVPDSTLELRAMLQAYLLHQVLGELGRELDEPSSRLQLPLQGIVFLVSAPSSRTPAG